MSEPQRSWNDPELLVQSDSTRTARYRRLQSWYRETELEVDHGFVERDGKPRPLGSLLAEHEVVKKPDLNFLDPIVGEYARRRAPVVQAQGGSIDQVRLTHNMLSSMPLCFNIFGALRARLELADLLRAVLDLDVTLVESAECEWSPGQAKSTELGIGDRTAFDAFVSYMTSTGDRGFLAIETKYTEPFSQHEYAVSNQYRAATDESGWFRPGSADELKGSATNQLWRNTMLAARLARESRLWTRGDVVVLRLADDPAADRAIGGVQDHMVDRGQLWSVTYEHLVQAARQIDGLAPWADAFDRRYLALPPV